MIGHDREQSNDGGTTHNFVEANGGGCFDDDTRCFMLRRREFHFSGLPSVLTLRQDFVAIEGTGGAVWRPSVEFARFMCSPKGSQCFSLVGKSVLEISSGLGLGAIVAWHLGASTVVATDIDVDGGPMALLAHNVTVNCGGPTSTKTNSSLDHSRSGQERVSVCQASGGDITSDREQNASRPCPIVQELRWGDEAQLAAALSYFGGVGPDVVLACDVVFDDGLLSALMETLVGACSLPTTTSRHPILCISHQRRNAEREDRFFAELERRMGEMGKGQGVAWREIHRDADLSVFVITWEVDLLGCNGVISEVRQAPSGVSVV